MLPYLTEFLLLIHPCLLFSFHSLCSAKIFKSDLLETLISGITVDGQAFYVDFYRTCLMCLMMLVTIAKIRPVQTSVRVRER
jgi:hypothetical protein